MVVIWAHQNCSKHYSVQIIYWYAFSCFPVWRKNKKLLRTPWDKRKLPFFWNFERLLFKMRHESNCMLLLLCCRTRYLTSYFITVRIMEAKDLFGKESAVYVKKAWIKYCSAQNKGQIWRNEMKIRNSVWAVSVRGKHVLSYTRDKRYRQGSLQRYHLSSRKNTVWGYAIKITKP